MALEDALGTLPDATYDTIQNTNDLTDAANQRLTVADNALAKRRERKGLGESTSYDPIQNTHELNVRAREMIDEQQRQAQPAPPVDYNKYGPTIDNSDPYSKYGPPVDQSAQTATPASPDKEGGGASASEDHGALSNIGRGAARGLAEGAAVAPFKGLAVVGGGRTQFSNPDTDAAAAAAGGGMVMPSTIPGEKVAPNAIQNDPIYKEAQQRQQAIESAIPMSDADKASLSGRIGSGIGAVAPALAAGIIGGPVAGAAAGAALFGLQGAADTFDEAIKHGASEENAAKAAGLGGAVGAALGGLPLGLVLKPLKDFAPALMGAATSALARYGLEAGKGAIAFATVGEAQEYLAEQIAKAYYDPKAGYSPDARRVIANLLLGGAVGAGLHALHGETPAKGTPGENALPPPGGGGGPGPEAGPKGPEAGPQADPAGNWSARKRNLMETVAADFARRNGDSHTAEDIRGWSNSQLYDYVLQSNRKSGPQAKPGEGEPIKPEAKATDADSEVLHQNGFPPEYVAGLSPEERKQQADLFRGESKKQDHEQPETTGGPGTRSNPINVTSPADVLKAGEQVKEPTPAQAEAENHKSGHLAIPELGLTGKNTVTIETPVGGTRKGPRIPLTAEQTKSADEHIAQLKHDVMTAEAHAADARQTAETSAHARDMARQFNELIAEIEDWKKNGKPDWEVKNYPAAYGRIKGLKGADGMNLDVMVGPGGQSFVIDQNDPTTGKFDEHKIMANWPSADAAKEAYLAAYEDHNNKRIRSITPITKDELWAHDFSKKEPYAKSKGKPIEQPKPEVTAGEDEGGTGLSGLNDLFGPGAKAPETTAGPSAPRAAEQPKPVEQPKALAEDKPSAEPASDIAAQINDLKDGVAHRKGVYIPKTTIDHLAKIGKSPDDYASTIKMGDEWRNTPQGKVHVTKMIWPTGPVQLPNFDGKGGVLIAADRSTADIAVRARDSQQMPMQEIIGWITGSGSGKPADGGAVVQQRDKNGNVTRERVTNETTHSETMSDFEAPDRTVHSLSPQEALKRREDLITQELMAKGNQDREKEGEGETTAGPSAPEPSDAHDHVQHIEKVLTDNGIDPRNVNQGDIRLAAEMLADGRMTDPAEAFVSAVALNGLHQGYFKLEDIKHAFGKEVPALLELDEGRPPVSGGPSAETGTTAGPSAPRGAEEGGEPQGSGETGGAEGEGGSQVGQQEQGEPIKQGSEVSQPGSTQPSGTSGAPETTGDGGSHGVGPRGGAAQPEHPKPASGEPAGPADLGTTAGPSAERPPKTTSEPPTNQPPAAPEGPATGVAETEPPKPETTAGPSTPKPTKAKTEKEKEEEKEKIKDAGEKLRNARKFKSKGGLTDQEIDNLNPTQKTIQITKVNIWSRPDYADLVANHGVEPMAAALLKRIYDKIPKKYFVPRFSGWDEKQAQDAFVKAVRSIRNALADIKTPADIRKAAEGLKANFQDKTGNTATINAARRDNTYDHPGDYTRQDERLAKKMVEDGFPNIEPWMRIFRTMHGTHYPTMGHEKVHTEDTQPFIDKMKAGGIGVSLTSPSGYKPGSLSLHKWREGGEGEPVPVLPESLTPEQRDWYDIFVRNMKLASRYPVWKVIRKSSNKTVSEHDTEQEATDAAKAAYAEFIKGDTSGGEMPTEHPHLDNLERIGPDWRKGRDIKDTSEFISEFGFLGSGWGNWVSQKERQMMLNLAWDGLHDLADMLGLSPKSLGFDAMMKMAFGANGRGGKGAAAAHYEPGDRAINMTKINGAGAQAHEWGHGFDHALGELDSVNPYGGTAKSISGWRDAPVKSTYKNNDRRLNNLPEALRKAINELMYALYWKPEPLADILARLKKEVDNDRAHVKSYNDQIDEIKAQVKAGTAPVGWRTTIRDKEYYRDIWKKSLATNKAKVREPEKYKDVTETNYFKNAQKLSGTGDYWKRPNEMFTRALETYVFDKLKAHGRQNDYLVQGVEDSRYSSPLYKGNPYLAGDERAAIHILFDELFKHLKSVKGTTKLANGLTIEGDKFAATDYDNPHTENIHDIISAASEYGKREQMINEALGVDDDSDLPSMGLADAFAVHFATDGFGSIAAAKSFATERGYDLKDKELEEEIEFGVVMAAREIVENNNSEAETTYAELIKLYERQPRLNTRTSTSIRDQAYSTPIPLAYLASRIAGITPTTNVYEPTAGNGALLIEASPKNVIANEINPKRADNLKEMGFAVTEDDASKDDENIVPQSYDVVIANPPFGSVDDNGSKKVFDLSDIQPGYETTQIDHAIALRSLKGLKNQGKAVFIVGSVHKLNSTPEDRFNAYNSEAKRHFYKALYDRYNVTDHFTVGGSLYERQGTTWPVDVIVINGVGKSELALPAVNLPMMFRTWDQLKGLLNGRTSRELQAKTGGATGPTTGPRPGTSHGGGGTKTPGGRSGGQSTQSPGGVGVLDGPDQPPTGPVSTGAGGGGGVQSGQSGQRGATDLGAGNGGPQRQPSGIKQLSDDELSSIFDDEVDKLTGKDTTTGQFDISPEPQEPEKPEPQPLPPNFKPEVYAKARKEFIAEAKKHPDLFEDMGALMRQMINGLNTQFNWQAEHRANMKPYILQFMKDVQTGKIILKRNKDDDRPPGTTQVPYGPVSKVNGLDTVSPINMANAMREASLHLQDQVGPLDAYVAKALGYEVPDGVEPASVLAKHFGGEQVDALAMSIFHMEHSSGSILGDQTGIGKGRVQAGNLLWAHRNNQVPVFFTEKPRLYADIYRDLKAIGFERYLGRKPRILMTNADEEVKLDENHTIKNGSVKLVDPILDKMQNGVDVLKDYDIVFTTYSQIQTLGAGKPETGRRNFLRRIAPDSVFVFDESHNAAGDADKGSATKASPLNRAGFARLMVGTSKATAYSSATYAKNPNAMVFYAKTNLRYAVADPKNLPSLFAKGGIPMQQVVAIMLALDGQYMRRERLFKGIDYNQADIPVDQEAYREICGSFADLNIFANTVKDIVKKNLNKIIAASGGTVKTSSAVGDISVQHTGFASLLHNAVSQMLLGMKADAAANMAIQSIKAGQKPLITVANTMESFLKDYIEVENELRAAQNKPLIKKGDPIPVTFNHVLLRYLEKSRTVTIKEAFGTKKDSKKFRLTDDILGPEGVALYNKAKAQIESFELPGVPISPIDYIRNKITKAGYKIKEATGRHQTLDYSKGGVPTLSSRDPAERGTNGTNNSVLQFNTRPENGGIHAMLQNQSNSTGSSMHSNKDFDDQSQRHTIIAQTEPDINQHMQQMGRTNRTGQVNKPTYTQLVATIPAEARPAALVMKKMASLSANTTAARTSEMTAKSSPDFLNEYGDEIAVQYLLDSPRVNMFLNNPLQLNADGYKEEGAMHRLTGRLALLYPEQQTEILDQLSDNYTSLIDQKNAAGENMLEAKVLPLEVRRIEGTEVMPAKPDTNSLFGASVVIQKVLAKRLTKPFSPLEIAEHLAKETGVPLSGHDPESIVKYLEKLDSDNHNLGYPDKINAETDAAQKEFKEWGDKYLNDIDNPVERLQQRDLLNKNHRQWSSIRRVMWPGTRYTLRFDGAAGNKTAIVIGMDRKGSAQNPIALSTWRITFAIAEGGRQMTIPYSRLFLTDAQGTSTSDPDQRNAIDVQPRGRSENYKSTLHNFELLNASQTEVRYIGVGNIPAAFDWFDNKGLITNYTDYAGYRHQGVLAPLGFDLAKQAARKGSPIKDAEELKAWLDANRGRDNISADGVISMRLHTGSYYRKSYQIDVPKNKDTGGHYYLAKSLTGISGDFSSTTYTTRENHKDVRRTVMRAEVSEDRILQTIKEMMRLGADFRIDKGDRVTFPYDDPMPEEEEAAQAEAPPEEGTTTGRFEAAPRMTPQAKSKEAKIEQFMRDTIAHFIGPDRVKVEFGSINPDSVTSAGYGGTVRGAPTASFNAGHNVIQLSMNIDDPLWVASSAFHESYHAVQNLLATDKERALMQHELPRLRTFVVKDRGAELATVGKISHFEVEALAFEAYMRMRIRNANPVGLHIGVKRAFERVMQLARRVKNGLQGLGFQTYEDIFEKVATGEMAKRPVRTDKPLLNDIRTAIAQAKSAAPTTAPPAADSTTGRFDFFKDKVKDRIEKLFPYDKRVSATEIFSDLGHREWLLQKEVEARILGLTSEELAKLHPAASKLPDAMQFYVNRRLMPGRQASTVRDVNNKYVRPFVKAANDGKITIDELGDYLQAKGVEQRNAQIAEAWRERPNSDFFKAARDPNVVGGSGWSNNEAQDVIRNAETGPKGAYYREIWTRFKDMTRLDLEMKLRYGLLTPEQVSEFVRRGEDYVPFKGHEDEPENAPDETGSKGTGPMGVRGKEYKQATGRRSRADNPAVHMIDQLYRTIDRGEQNAHFNSVAQSLGETKMLGHDISDIASLNKPKVKRILDKNTGLVREVPDTSELNNPRAVHFKFRGRPRYMIFKSQPLAEAIKRTRPPFPKQLRFALVGVNKLKSLWTHYSPTFIPKHFARYYVEGFLNMSEYKGRANGNVSMTEWAKTALPGLGKSSLAIKAVEEGKTSHTDPEINALMRSYREMKQYGGNQSFRAMRDLDGIRDELSRELDNISKGKPINQAKRSLRKVTEAIDHMFDILTNAQQLATYAQLRKNGTPGQKAAYIARETNVDMQKNGLISYWAGLFMPFFRIAVNIGTRFSGAYKRSPNYRNAVHAVFMAGAGLALWNYIMGGNDKDGTPFFEKIPSWDRALNMIVMNPWHTDDKGRPMPYKLPFLFNWALPLTFGYHATGMALSSMGAIKSKITMGEHLGDMVKSVLMAFTPLGEIGNPLDLMTPELAKGPAHVLENKDWQGRPIHQDETFQKGPNAYSGKTDFAGQVRTGEAWKEAAQFVNWATGGSRVKSGYVDPYPESIRELVEQPFGAQIRFGQDIAKTGGSIMKGEVPKAKDIPILKTFAGTDYDAADRAASAERGDRSKHPWKY